MNKRLFWITGFSGSGKTTTARALVKKLQEELNIQAVLLDGDELRAALNRTIQFQKQDRLELAYTYAKLGKLLCDQGFVVIIATVSMFDEVRQWNRENIKNYVEVYLQVDLEERIRRDPKKLYQTEDRGSMVTESAFEEPKTPDLVFKGEERLPPSQVVENIINFLKEYKNEN
jgi:adenylylsulfate kinase